MDIFLKLLLIFILIGAPPVWAATTQVVIGGSSVLLPTAATTVYMNFMGNTTFTYSTTEASFQQIVSAPGTLSNFRVLLDATTGAGKSYAFRLRKNGGYGGGNGNITCTVSNSTTCTDLVNTDAVVAGDVLSISITPAGTPTASRPRWTFDFTPTTSNETNFSLGSATFQNGDGLPLIGNSVGYAAAPARARSVFPVAGTLSNMYVRGASNEGVGDSNEFIVEKDGVDSNIICTILEGTSTCNDIDTLSVSAGTELLVYSFAAIAGVNNYHLGWTFTPTTIGDQVVTSNDGATMTSNSTQYMQVASADAVLTTTETQAYQLTNAITFTAMSATIDGVAGAGAGYTFTLRIAGATPGGDNLTCTISGASATTCTDTGTVTATAGQTVNWMKEISAGVPTVRRARLGLAGNIAPTGGARRTMLIQ